MDGAAQVVHHGRSAATRPLMPFAVPWRRWLRDGAPAVHQSRSTAVKRKGLFILRKRSSDATSGSLSLVERVRMRRCELAPHPSSDIPSPRLRQRERRTVADLPRSPSRLRKTNPPRRDVRAGPSARAPCAKRTHGGASSGSAVCWLLPAFLFCR